ncbi:MAG: hypothetical protein HUJ54_14290, partial [Erysipelotrichaceae bacterium]|nr:hypothetical protein [Erysipelotrichaceae bacterium]
KGEKIKSWKYGQLEDKEREEFHNSLVRWSSKLIKNQWVLENGEKVIAVPVTSISQTNQVPDLCRLIAEELRIEYHPDIITKVDTGKNQQDCLTPQEKENNAINSFSLEENLLKHIRQRTILLVNDMVDSGWTFTVLAARLRDCGAKKVIPFALLNTGIY